MAHLSRAREMAKLRFDPVTYRSWTKTKELTDKEIHLLAQLSRRRGLYAECKGTDLDTLQKLGLLQWFGARSSTTPFKEDLRAFLKLHGVSGRIDYAWVAAVENWRELVGPEVSARVDAIGEIERAVNICPFSWSRVSRADELWPKIVER
jgi:hypothetical protein